MASVRRRDPNDPTSPWVCEYTDESGKRRRITPKTGLKKDAEAARRKIEAEIEGGTHTAKAESVTVREACDLYLKNLEHRVKSGTMGRVYQGTVTRVIDKWILPPLGPKLFSELRWEDIDATQQRMLKRLAPVTTKSNMQILKQVESLAFRRGYTKKKLVSDVSREAGGAPSARIRTFTLDEIKRLIAVAEERSPAQRRRGHLLLKCALHLAVFAGLRFGEIVGLTVENVDLEKRVLLIRHSLTQLDELKGPKTRAGNREVPIPQHVVLILAEWLRLYYVANDRDLIFREPDGSHIFRSGFHVNLWHRLLKKAELYERDNKFHFHALRHFNASMLIEMKVPLTEVASLLGHEKFDMTLQVYAHPINGGHRRHEAFERMSLALASVSDKNATLEPKLLELHA